MCAYKLDTRLVDTTYICRNLRILSAPLVHRDPHSVCAVLASGMNLLGMYSKSKCFHVFLHPVANNVTAKHRSFAWEWCLIDLNVQGLAKNVGVSNMSIKKLKVVLSYAKVKPAVNQVEVHPYFRNQELIEYCASEGVHVTAYSSLGTPSSAGHLVKKSAPNPSHVCHSLVSLLNALLS